MKKDRQARPIGIRFIQIVNKVLLIDKNSIISAENLDS